ncbi:Eukaryotic peptide chain release factor GTP-binding subunit [Lunasporangiospora selenospora]|uniref:Eukaryotic peptide chain release factor GTP-binding subunit n=1 Tax=Lunasporangiospora selenospora TaxID=979761 RepID=A0A9P6KHR0_9FUNG|nr:Eukaryotic peptide chain release factor GTP-binding subunit [Lunasporangiospora selenospora]
MDAAANRSPDSARNGHHVGSALMPPLLLPPNQDPISRLHPSSLPVSGRRGSNSSTASSTASKGSFTSSEIETVAHTDDTLTTIHDSSPKAALASDFTRVNCNSVYPTTPSYIAQDAAALAVDRNYSNSCSNRKDILPTNNADQSRALNLKGLDIFYQEGRLNGQSVAGVNAANASPLPSATLGLVSSATTSPVTIVPESSSSILSSAQRRALNDDEGHSSSRNDDGACLKPDASEPSYLSFQSFFSTPSTNAERGINFEQMLAANSAIGTATHGAQLPHDYPAIAMPPHSRSTGITNSSNSGINEGYIIGNNSHASIISSLPRSMPMETGITNPPATAIATLSNPNSSNKSYGPRSAMAISGATTASHHSPSSPSSSSQSRLSGAKASRSPSMGASVTNVVVVDEDNNPIPNQAGHGGSFSPSSDPASIETILSVVGHVPGTTREDLEEESLDYRLKGLQRASRGYPANFEANGWTASSGDNEEGEKRAPMDHLVGSHSKAASPQDGIQKNPLYSMTTADPFASLGTPAEVYTPVAAATLLSKTQGKESASSSRRSSEMMPLSEFLAQPVDDFANNRSGGESSTEDNRVHGDGWMINTGYGMGFRRYSPPSSPPPPTMFLSSQTGKVPITAANGDFSGFQMFKSQSPVDALTNKRPKSDKTPWASPRSTGAAASTASTGRHLSTAAMHLSQDGQLHSSSVVGTTGGQIHEDDEDDRLSEHGEVVRNYKIFPGRNLFFCGGRIMTSRDFPAFMVAILLLLVPTGLFLGFTSPYLWHRLSPAAPIVHAYVFIIAFSSMLKTSWTDPGVIPRAYAFLTSALCLTHLLVLYHDRKDESLREGEPKPSFQMDALAKAPVSALLMIYGLIMGLAVGALAVYHYWLATKNRTTHEQLSASMLRPYVVDNPFDRGSILGNCLAVLCRPPTRSYIRRRDYTVA